MQRGYDRLLHNIYIQMYMYMLNSEKIWKIQKTIRNFSTQSRFIVTDDTKDHSELSDTE